MGISAVPTFATVAAATVAGAGVAEVLVVAVVPESEVVLAGLELLDLLLPREAHPPGPLLLLPATGGVRGRGTRDRVGV